MNFPACLTCLFWVVQPIAVKSGVRLGHCRAHAPITAARALDGKQRTIWPMVSETDWCGDHSTEGTDATAD